MQASTQSKATDVSAVLAEHFAAIRACCVSEPEQAAIIQRLTTLKHQAERHINTQSKQVTLA